MPPQAVLQPLARTYYRVAVIGAITLLTVSIHYGFILEPIFGEQHWIHAIHGRLCYIPIVMASTWSGLRGGLSAAAVISLLVLPYLFLNNIGAHNMAGEVTEIIFYFALAGLIGSLVGRELKVRRKQQETELALARSQQLSLVGQMAAGVAHEIKNPLASIKGAVEILVDKDTPEPAREEFGYIVVRETRRIDRTLRDFLEFGRPRESKVKAMDLSETVAAGLRQMESQAITAGVTRCREIEPGVIVAADAEKMHQVMLNLLLNALEATPKGGTVTIRVESTGRTARLSVADTGAGIPADALERVFDPFYTTKSSGSGLGLAVVKQIIENHNGAIKVESTCGHGTTFTITLPSTEGR